MELNLKIFGLTDTESKVYLALLGLGKSKAGPITKQSGVNRTNVYDALERLIEKGMVSYITENNTRYFTAVSPSRLKEIIEEKQARLISTLEELNKIYAEPDAAADATIFRDKKGIKSIFQDILNDRAELWSYGAEGSFGEMFPYYHKHWNEERASLGIKVKIIYSGKARGKRRDQLKLIKMRYLPESYEFPSMILVYGDKVVTIVWTNVPFAFMIKSKEAVQSHKNYFEMLWKIAKV